jgi:hypothetical protein
VLVSVDGLDGARLQYVKRDLCERNAWLGSTVVRDIYLVLMTT